MQYDAMQSDAMQRQRKERQYIELYNRKTQTLKHQLTQISYDGTSPISYVELFNRWLHAHVFSLACRAVRLRCDSHKPFRTNTKHSTVLCGHIC